MSQLFFDFTEASFQCASESVTQPRQRSTSSQTMSHDAKSIFCEGGGGNSKRLYYQNPNITVRDINYTLDYTAEFQQTFFNRNVVTL